MDHIRSTAKLLTVLLWLTVGLLCAQDPMTKVIVQNQIELQIPQEFIEMNAQDIRNKFISYKQPLAGYTTIDRRVDLVINVNATPWMDQDIQLLQEFYRNNILNLFDDVDFIQEGIKQINGREYAVFEFISTVKGDPNSFKNRAAVVDYTYVQYTIKDQKAYVFTFHCGAHMKDRWQNTATAIMSSPQFK